MLLAAPLLLSACDAFDSAVDERAPLVSLVRPATDVEVAGANVLVRVQAEALGEGNFISFVNVNLDGDRLGEAELVDGQYVFRWNTFDRPDGVYRLEAVAFDRLQARGISAPVRVTVANESAGDGPELALIAPVDGDRVDGRVNVIARPLTPGTSLTRVDFLVDGVRVFTTTEATGTDTYVFEWDTRNEGAGLHVLEVKGFADAGVFRLSAPVSVTLPERPVGPDGTGDDGTNDDTRPPGEQTPGRLSFRAAGFTGEVRGSVAVGFNNDLYVGSTSDTLYAFTRRGKLRWTFATNGPIRSSPLVGNNEDVFVTSEDGRLYGLTSTGAQLWTPYNARTELLSTPAMGVDAVLYVGDAAGRLHAVNAFDGQSRPGWPIQVANGSIVVPPVITRSNTLIVAAVDGYVRSIDLEHGTPVWTSTQNVGSVTVGMALVERTFTVALPGGQTRTTTVTVVYVVSNQGRLYALSGEDGSVLWSEALAGPVRSAPVVGPDGAVYVGTSTGLMAFNEEANAFTPRLRFFFPARDVGTPVIDANEVIYFVGGDRLQAINPNNTPVWSFDLNTQADGPLTLNREGLLLTAGTNGLLFAFETGAVGLARAKWPMFQRNARHTGRLGLDADD